MDYQLLLLLFCLIIIDSFSTFDNYKLGGALLLGPFRGSSFPGEVCTAWSDVMPTQTRPMILDHPFVWF